jgi:hypothetical protein
LARVRDLEEAECLIHLDPDTLSGETSARIPP